MMPDSESNPTIAAPSPPGAAIVRVFSASRSIKYHFISGRARSGSTLTSTHMRQNPRFHAVISSPVAGLMEGILSKVSAGTEMTGMANEKQRARICIWKLL